MTPASTTESFLVSNDSAEMELGLHLEWDKDIVTPGNTALKPFKRIVGGKVVIPGEIPWQVQYRGRCEEWMDLLRELNEKVTAGVLFSALFR